MSLKPRSPRFLCLALILSGPFVGAGARADAPKPKVTFEEVSAQVFKNRCNSCHNADKQKGGLNLETYSTAMAGGGSGKVIEAGDSGASTIFKVVNHSEEPKMPPKSPKIPDPEIDLIKQWIDAGALENSGSTAMVKAKPKFEFKLDPSSMGKPVGPPAMPENLVTEPVVVSSKAPAVVAMAASPWAPLVAVGGHKQILLYGTANSRLLGVLPFPEGSINVLKFSRNGSLLLAGGGRGGQSGLAVVWDVKTGKRVFEIGKEYDAVLTADISPDHGSVALGGPSKIVRVYSTADGQLQFEMKKHTEWITAMEYSPDGVLLATGDRNNGLIVWEAATGREYFDLRGHTGAITDISWRLDSNVVASASEDTTIRLWEMENGNPIKSWGAHGPGVASVRFAKDGRLVSTGRDRVPKLWDQNGGQQRAFEAFNDLALEAVLSFDDALVVAADWTGEVRVFNAADGKRLANLASNPAPIVNRLEAAKTLLTTAQAAADAAQKAFAPFQEVVTAKSTLTDQANQALTAVSEQIKAGMALEKQLEPAYNAALNDEKATADALKGAREGLAKAVADKLAAEKAMTEKAAAEVVSLEALTAAKQAVEKSLVDKAEHDKVLVSAVDALKASKTAAESEKAAGEISKQASRSTELTAGLGLAGGRQSEAQAKLEKAVADKAATPAVLEKAVATMTAAEALAKSKEADLQAMAVKKSAAEKALTDARNAYKALEPVAVTRKAELDQAAAAKAAAEKGLADAKPALDLAINALNAAKAETDALAAEKKRADSAKSAMIDSPPKG